MPIYSKYDVPNVNTMVNFGTGQPNNMLLPMQWFQQTCLKMSTDMFGSNTNEHNQLLQYGAISGYPAIRQKMAEWLSEKYYDNLNQSDLNVEKKIHPSQLFMTNGSTGSLHLLISKYCESGESIIVDNPSYFLALNIFKEYGLTVEGVDIKSNDGINITDLENKIKKINKEKEQSVLFYYSIPTHHNPTGITLSHAKRKKLSELCEKYPNLYIIADEVYHFLSFNSEIDFYPMADYHPKIVSIGSFSKILAPALRVGWIYQNTNLFNYDDTYGFIRGETGLNMSSVLDSSGGINPIGFKFIEYALDKSDGVRPIDKIIDTHIAYLKQNCQMMVEYLTQFPNVCFIKPTGGYFLWLGCKSIKSTANLLKVCEKNKVKYHPGVKFSTNGSFDNCIRLSFSYYNSDDILTGLDRLMDSIANYNKISVRVHGASGKLGSLIKKEILSNNDFNYLGDIKREFNTDDFLIMSPFNSVIIDVSSNDGTFNLITSLVKTKNYIPVIIGTTGLADKTIGLIKTYASNAPVALVSNFSEGIPLIRQMAKLSNDLTPAWNFSMKEIHHVNKKDAPSGTAKIIMNEILRNVPVESIREGDVIGEHTLELTNGTETIKITHSVSDRTTFAKGCLNYAYWILTKNGGFFNLMDKPDNVIRYNNGENVFIYNINKDLPEVVINHLIGQINASYKEITRIIFLRELDDCEFNARIFKVKPSVEELEYCGISLLEATKLITDFEGYDSSYINVGDTHYKYISSSKINTNSNDETNSGNKPEYKMIELPFMSYLAGSKNDNSIEEIIGQMTNMTLYGIGRYSFANKKYLVLEIKDNVFESDMLETISTIINTYQKENSKYSVIFINTFSHKLNYISVRCFDTDSVEQTNNMFMIASCLDYYQFHFVKEVNCLNVTIHQSGTNYLNVMYYDNLVYLYEIYK
jgi:DNA-binding transcriptional MocR family regulator/dihydrodipicolinate reductase